MDSEHASPANLETELYYEISVHLPQLWPFSAWPRFVRKSPTWSSFSAMPNKPSSPATNELAIQKYQLRTRGSLLPAAPLGRRRQGKTEIVERISEQERPNKTKAKVISRVLPSP
jgi:hypothetical protein